MIYTVILGRMTARAEYDFGCFPVQAADMKQARAAALEQARAEDIAAAKKELGDEYAEQQFDDDYQEPLVVATILGSPEMEVY